MTDVYHGLQQTVIDEARTSEWRISLPACALVREMDVLSTCFSLKLSYCVSDMWAAVGVVVFACILIFCKRLSVFVKYRSSLLSF